MPLASITKAQVWEDANAILMARVLGNDGNAVVQANFGSINVKLFDRDSDTPTTDLISNRSLTVSSVIFDTLQTSDSRWTADSTGYNFLYVLPGTDLTTPTLYRAEVTLTPTGEVGFPVVYELEALNIVGS